MRLGCAVVFLQRCDGGIEIGLDGRALATRDAATQLGPQFFNVVLKRDHRPLLRFEDGAGAPRRSGRVKDAEGAAERGAEEPILSSAGDKPARFSALITLGKIGRAALRSHVKCPV